jgi:3-oxoadipate enol-lactonase
MTVSHPVAQGAAGQRWPLDAGGALLVRGEPGDAPVLFLHGVGGAAWSWEPQARALASDRRTYAWEARGHGGAAPVADAGLADYYDDAEEALSRILAVEGRNPIVAGHSLGGLLALALAASRPADVAALFLVEPVYLSEGHAFSRLAGLGPLTLFAPQMLPFLLMLAEGLKADALPARMHARSLFEFSFHDRTAMERWWTFQRAQVPAEYRRLILELAGASTRFPLRQYAKEVTAPVRVLEGDNAWIRFAFPNLSEQLRRLGSDFTRRVISGGHYLQLDREDAVTADLREFVATLAPAG